MTSSPSNASNPALAFSRISEDTVLGQRVSLPAFCNLYGCTIGDDCMIGPFVEIQRGAKLGNRVKVQSHTFICSDVTIEDEAFVGHGVMFINDRFPRATTLKGEKKGADDWHCEPTTVGKRASIGSNATILCGVTIGEGAIIGAGSVVTRDVPANSIAVGNPARVTRRVRESDEQIPAKGTVSEPAAVAEPQAVPFLNLSDQHRALKDELLEAIGDILDSAAFVGGKAVTDFEDEFAKFTHSKRAISVSSGTDALRFTLQAMGVQPGRSVITVPNTFVATTAAVTQAGGEIEFVDVDPNTCLLDPNRLEDHLRRRSQSRAGARPAAIIPVHLYGQCADMDSILDIARRYDLRVLEDAAQAHGSLYRGRPAGSLGDAAAFSFYPGKNLGACGEGGAVTTNDPDIAHHVELRRDHGRSGKYSHTIEGYNGRLHSMQAAILRVKLKHLHQANSHRQRCALRYTRSLANLRYVRPVRVLDDRVSCFHLYVVRSARRDELQRYLTEQKIASGIHYPIALHLQECYIRLGHRPGAFPESEAACREVLSLPIFPGMTDEQVDRVVQVVQAYDSKALRDLVPRAA